MSEKPAAAQAQADPGWSELETQRLAREARADEGGGRARQDRLKRLGKLTARERIAGLVDEGTFLESGRHVVHRHSQSGTSEVLAANQHPGDGLVCGLAAIAGCTVVVYAHDPTVLRGALGHTAAQKLCKLLDLAGERGFPVIALVDCDGVRVEEGTFAIEAYGEILRRTVRLKGRVPQITLACGLCVGAAAYCATLTDLVGMVQGQSWMFITGPKVTKVVTGADVSLDDLGGPELHGRKTGAVHAVLPSEQAGLDWVRDVLRHLREAKVTDPKLRFTPELESVIPTAPRRAYDVRRVLGAVFDQGSVLELSAKFGGSLVTALAHLGGRPVAVVASNPMVLAGCLDIDASRKGAAFVSFAAQRGLPIITLVDVPGYLPGQKQEEGGIIPHGATLLTAYGNAKVPLVCLVLRKSFGGASILSFAADLRFALPTARIGPMGADATLEVVLGPELPDATEEGKAARAAKRADWLARQDHAWAAAEAGYIDQVIAPAEVRQKLCAAVDRLTAERPHA